MIDPLILIRASAGSGKTYTLVVRYLALLLRGVPVQRILASTFTRKAAAEIKSRVFTQLALAADGIDECKKLAAAVELPALTMQECQIALQRVVADQHRLAISTIDGIAVQIARCSAAELGLSPRLGILDDINIGSVRRSAILRLKSNIERNALLTILAGFFSGETPSALADRLEEAFGNLLDLAAEIPSQGLQDIKALPRLSAAELQQIENGLASFQIPLTGKGQPNQNWVKAIKKLRDAVSAGRWQDLTAGGIVEAVVEGTFTYSKVPIPDDLVALLRQIVGHLAGVFSSEILDRSKAFKALLLAYHSEYQECLAQRGEYGFSDLKRIVARATTSHQLESLLYRLDSRYEHVLLDEFQDTSRLDWMLLQPIVDGAANGSDSSRSFLCVGDPKQGIYGWRGGILEIFEHLVSHYPLLKQRDLALTRRSSAAITQFVNQLFENLNTLNFPAHQAEAIENWRTNFPKHSTSRSEVTGLVEISPCPEDQIFQSAIELARKLSSAHPKASLAVLFNTNQQISIFGNLARRLAPELEFSREGKRQLAESPAVRLLLSLLRLVDHPEDTVSVFHLEHSPLKDLLGDLASAQTRAAFSLQSRQVIANLGLLGFLRRFVLCLQRTAVRSDLEALREFLLLVEEHKPQERISLAVKRALVCSYADSQGESIRLMTIHAAKGLEFDRVIYPIANTNLIKENVDFLVDRREAMSPPQRIVRVGRSVEARFVPEVLELIEQNNQRKVCERLNLLYVALTRARDELFIFLPDAPDQRSLAALVTNSLSGVLGQNERFAIGKAAATSTIDDSGVAATAALVKRAQQRISEIASAGRSIKRIAVINASNSTSPNRELQHIAKNAGSRSALRKVGIVAHAAMQSIEWIDQDRNDLAPQIAALFKRDRYHSAAKVDLWRERRFAVLMDNEIVSGRFDRVVVQRDVEGRIFAAEIIDFKIGSRNQDVSDQQVRRHQPQLQLYARALRSILNVSTIDIKMNLAFIEAGCVLEVLAIPA